MDFFKFRIFFFIGLSVFERPFCLVLDFSLWHPKDNADISTNFQVLHYYMFLGYSWKGIEENPSDFLTHKTLRVLSGILNL